MKKHYHMVLTVVRFLRIKWVNKFSRAILICIQYKLCLNNTITKLGIIYRVVTDTGLLVWSLKSREQVVGWFTAASMSNNMAGTVINITASSYCHRALISRNLLHSWSLLHSTYICLLWVIKSSIQNLNGLLVVQEWFLK